MGLLSKFATCWITLFQKKNHPQNKNFLPEDVWWFFQSGKCTILPSPALLYILFFLPLQNNTVSQWLSPIPNQELIQQKLCFSSLGIGENSDLNLPFGPGAEQFLRVLGILIAVFLWVLFYGSLPKPLHLFSQGTFFPSDPPPGLLQQPFLFHCYLQTILSVTA